MEKPLVTFSTVLEVTVRENGFYEKVIKLYDEWVSRGNGVENQIYRPPNFQGDWKTILPEEYVLHMLSTIGIPDNFVATDIVPILHTYRVEALTSERIEIVQRAYEALNENIKEHGLFAGSFDPNSLFFLPEQRIQNIVGNRRDDLAYTMKGDIGEILIPQDSQDLNTETAQLFDVVIHELGHQVRKRNRLDTDATTILNEGIIQAKAQEIETSCGQVSMRTKTVYVFEAQVVNDLVRVLQVPSLFHLPFEQIRELVNKHYETYGSMSEPYGDLIYDMYEYNLLFRRFQAEIEGNENILKERVAQMRSELQAQRQMFDRRWKLGN
ncbi:MAG: hypothetical protein UX04_C0002G0307 [Microgenomates group bacterium GW2011_GWF2_45_18]|nr:MAG: hypothetical protein UW18_C0003G0255 [Microgenomates group bacterium GW2011_GWF1_44_10]KKU02164.1 MAG: hypothetical protein UX04_C0002G0307 [Microgenomates group bacterium GW2011_GWF2_45_18]HAU98714.1 hypothetical protein [Candidatus Paceibacterota bacterium]HAX01860.1 hypothetical protein [Candidatus Paceibacterota bacterium]